VVVGVETRKTTLVRKTVSLLLVIVAALFISSPLFTIGGHEAVICISRLGRLTIAGLGTGAAVLMLAWLVRASRGNYASYQLSSLRRDYPGKWLWRILVMTCAMFFAVAIFSLLWIRVMVRHLPATLTEETATVSKITRTGSHNIFCRLIVDVRLSSGEDVRTCGELGLLSRIVQPGVVGLTANDTVTVVLRNTMFGVSASIGPRRAFSEEISTMPAR
jgi:hypothetical protein